MNKKQIIASLNKIATELDLIELYKEANTITKVMTRLADDMDNIESAGDWRDSLLDPQQKADVARGNHLESVFKIFEDNFKQMMGEKHSGFSGTFIRMMVKNYWMNTPADRKQIKELYEWKTRNSDAEFLLIEKAMDSEVLKMINFTEEFQQTHGVPDEVMLDYINALR